MYFPAHQTGSEKGYILKEKNLFFVPLGLLASSKKVFIKKETFALKGEHFFFKNKPKGSRLFSFRINPWGANSFLSEQTPFRKAIAPRYRELAYFELPLNSK